MIIPESQDYSPRSNAFSYLEQSEVFVSLKLTQNLEKVSKFSVFWNKCSSFATLASLNYVFAEMIRVENDQVLSWSFASDYILQTILDIPAVFYCCHPRCLHIHTRSPLLFAVWGSWGSHTRPDPFRSLPYMAANTTAHLRQCSRGHNCPTGEIADVSRVCFPFYCPWIYPGMKNYYEKKII